jgi:hypothetical protein
MLKPLFIAALLASPAILPALAQQAADRPEALREFVTAKAGETVRVWTFFDCEDPRDAPTAFGSAANGSIVVRRGSELQCGNPEQPVAQVFYTPREGFSGEDDAVVRGPRGQEVQIKLWVSQPVETASPAASAAASAVAAAGPAAATPRQPRLTKAAGAKAAEGSARAAPARRHKTAGKSRSCSSRGQAAIVRLWRCEFIDSLRSSGRKRVVRSEADSAR